MNTESTHERKPGPLTENQPPTDTKFHLHLTLHMAAVHFDKINSPKAPPTAGCKTLSCHLLVTSRPRHRLMGKVKRLAASQVQNVSYQEQSFFFSVQLHIELLHLHYNHRQKWRILEGNRTKIVSLQNHRILYLKVWHKPFLVWENVPRFLAHISH